MSKCPSLPTGPIKPCTITYATQTDRMNEPPPQPRVRKVTTIINTLGVVVRDSATEIAVWVLTACEEKCFPKTKQHMFLSFPLGTWIIVGIYPDGTIASFSPWPLLLKAYETKVFQGQVLIRRCTSELHHEKAVTYSDAVGYVFNTTANITYFERDPQYTAEFYMIPGFGRVLVSSNFRQQVDNGKFNFWAQYCGGQIKGCSWMMSNLECTKDNTGAGTEKELRAAGEFIKESRSKAEVIKCPDKYISRNVGIVMDIYSNKQQICCWSPFSPFETDHTAKMPQPPKHREIECPLLDPVVGQWIQFDVLSKDLDRYMGTKPGYRLSIQEYLPINSPCGIGVVSGNKTIRVALSCVLVTGTDHPLLYELPTFGYVVDPKASLVSGTHMQFILEKTTSKTRRLSGVCWKVISSAVVDVSDVTVEKVKDIRTEAILLKDAMEPCKITPIEKQSSASHSKAYPVQSTMSLLPASNITGVITLKYQQPQHHASYHDPKKDFYSGNNGRLPPLYTNTTRTSRYPSKSMFRGLSNYTESVLEVHGIVEKVTFELKTGILWVFDDFNTSVHFVFDIFNFKIGDYVYARFEKKADPTSNSGYKWKWTGGTMQNAPFTCHVHEKQIFVETDIELNPHSNGQRICYKSKFFPQVLDTENYIKNPQLKEIYTVVVWRKRLFEEGTKPRFTWTVYSLQNSSFSFKDVNYPRNSNNKHKSSVISLTEFKSSRSSDHSSVSPPINGSSLPSSEE